MINWIANLFGYQFTKIQHIELTEDNNIPMYLPASVLVSKKLKDDMYGYKSHYLAHRIYQIYLTQIIEDIYNEVFGPVHEHEANAKELEKIVEDCGDCLLG